MNERIKELVRQAGGIAHDDDSNELTPMLVGKELEKFAKLIVRECSDIATNSFENDIGHPGDLIDKHFGVE